MTYARGVLGFGHSGGQQEPGPATLAHRDVAPLSGWWPSWVAGAPALAVGRPIAMAPAAEAMGWPVLPWQLADGGFGRVSGEAATAARWPSCSTTALSALTAPLWLARSSYQITCIKT